MKTTMRFKIKRNITLPLFVALITFWFVMPVSALNYERGHLSSTKDIFELIKQYEDVLDANNPNTETWRSFVEQFRATRRNLAELTCDLPKPFEQTWTQVCISSNNLEAELAQLQAQVGDPETRVSAVEFYYSNPDPYSTDETATIECYKVYYDPPQECDYDPSDNMDKFGDKLIKELKYTNFERHFDSEPGYCFMDPVAPDVGADPYHALGPVLGRWSAKVDDELDDSWLWLKGSNNGGAEILTDIITKALQYALILSNPVVAIVAGIRCIVRKLRGESCNYSGLAPELPIDELQAMLPGVGNFNSDTFVGLWHMMHVGRKGDGEYNEIPGTDLAWAGPGLITGLMDKIVMLAADATGLTLNGIKSKGPDRYGPYDDKEVREYYWEWQLENIGHMEWSSLSSLGQYGWAKFAKDPTGSKYLGWPIHALGDTVVPHHLYGTMGFNHLAFEHAMNSAIHKLFWGEEKGEEGQGDQENELAIIQNSFKWWKQFCWDDSAGQKKNLESAKKLIDAVAMDNKQYSTSWALKDELNISAFFSEKVKERVANEYLNDGGIWHYGESMVSNSMGAILALLVCASDMVAYSPDSESIGTKCEVGKGYCPSWTCGFECTDGYTGAGPIGEVPDVEVFSESEELSGDCRIGACSSNEECPGTSVCDLAIGCCVPIVIE